MNWTTSTRKPPSVDAGPSTLLRGVTGRLRQLKHRAQRGLTLVECCATLAVASLLAGAASGSFSDLLQRVRLAAGSDQLLADIQYLKSEALTRNTGLRISFGQGEQRDCYILHTGPSDVCSCAGPAAPSCQGPESVVLKAVALPSRNGITIKSNVSSIHFDPRVGTSSPAGTILMMDKQGRSIHHVVSIRGRVRTCSDSSLHRGTPKC